VVPTDCESQNNFQSTNDVDSPVPDVDSPVPYSPRTPQELNTRNPAQYPLPESIIRDLDGHTVPTDCQSQNHPQSTNDSPVPAVNSPVPAVNSPVPAVNSPVPAVNSPVPNSPPTPQERNTRNPAQYPLPESIIRVLDGLRTVDFLPAPLNNNPSQPQRPLSERSEATTTTPTPALRRSSRLSQTATPTSAPARSGRGRRARPL
jgi:hypothetical protein